MKCESEKLFEKLYKIPKYKEELKKIESYSRNELSYDFLGFVEQYKALASIIPLDWTIYDLGCYAGIQSYYFRKHKKYIGVDQSPVHKFNTDNSEYYRSDIDKFLLPWKVGPKSFAICNYVPLKNYDMIKRRFNNLFIFYPQS